MTQHGTNENSNNVIYVDTDAVDRAMQALPRSLRNLLLYEVGSNINPVQLVEIHDPFFGPDWLEIERLVRDFSHNEHKEAFNGIYPGVQRKLTARDGPSEAKPANKRPTVNALRMLRRSGSLRSRRDFRRIAVFFDDLTGPPGRGKV